MENMLPGKPISKSVEARLKHFNIYRALASDSRKMGALALQDFYRLAIGSSAVLSQKEKEKLGDAEFESIVKGAFIYLDGNQDGLLCPKDADKDGLITDYSRIQAMYNRELRKGESYSDVESWKADAITKAAKKFMDGRRRAIEESRVKIAHDGAYVYSYSVPLLYLEPEQTGTSILHLSDIHFKKDGKRNGQKIGFLTTLKEKIQTPDVVIITGDIIDSIAEDFVDGAKKAFAELFPSAQRFFVLGNHDFRNGAAASVASAMEGAGYLNITNQHIVVEVKGKMMGVTGVDDYQEGVKWVPSLPESSIFLPNILATHNLDAVDGAYQGCFDLVLTGHTHLGEKDFIFFDGTDILKLLGAYKGTNGQKDEWGLASQRTIFHITSGLGTHTTRFNATPEGVSYITLKCG